tara:strand:- start:3014 stop:3310 length:297 start_codon:yes stop_codon:yes gene_type:complete
MKIIKGQLSSLPPTVPGSSICVRFIQIDWGKVKVASWVGPIPKVSNNIEHKMTNERENKVNPRIILEVPFEMKLSNLYLNLVIKVALVVKGVVDLIFA